MRKNFLSILCLILSLVLSICILGVDAEETSNKTIKKVVSIVYDDSGSMNSENEDWAYASYSLQNLVGLMNEQDELGVVKMSEPTQMIQFDLSNNELRKNDIKSIEGWIPIGGTPFSAVDTAINWMKDKKTTYADSRTVEFWLVILTDGNFSDYPSNINEYLTNLKTFMGNSKFESVFVAIGNQVPDTVKKDWSSITGSHVITSSNSSDIINAMSEVSGLLLGQGGKETQLDISLSQNKKEITFESYFPLKKFIVYQQNQNLEIKNISANEANVKVTANFTANNPGKKKVTSKTIHCEADGTYFIPAGKTNIQFTSEIDTSNNKLKILTEPAVDVKLKVLDKTGKEIKDLNSISVTEGELIEFVSIVTSSIDKSPIDLKKWQNELSAELVINNQTIEMKYDSKDNAFYATYQVTSGGNLAYSTVTLPGYFRAKSDMLNLYPKEKMDEMSVKLSNNTIDVPYKYTKKYEEIATFTYEVSGGTINGICDFKFKNMPKGITISVNGVYADKNGNLSVKIQNNIPADVKLYRNKDYKEKEQSKILIDVTSDKYELEWREDSITEIILNPVKRKLTVESIPIEENNSISLSDFKRKEIYIMSVLGDKEYLTKEELETLTLDYQKITGIELEKEVIEYNGRHAIKIIAKRTIPRLFVKTGNIENNITLTTKYAEHTSKEKLEFEVKDSILKYLLPIILLILIILLIGYLPGVKKKLYPKKYHIKNNGELEAIHVKTISRLIPYIKEKGFGSDLTLIATSNKNKVSIVNNFTPEQSILISGEAIPDNSSKFDLFVGEELKISDGIRETIYIYCVSENDDSLDDKFYETNDMDDIFEKNKEKTTSNNPEDDEFFN